MEKQSKKHVWNNIKSIIFYVFAGILISYILIEVVLPSQTIKIFQFKPYVVVTESMEPVIKVNDLIIVTNPNLDKLEVGDIITFEADIDYNGTKEVVTHYIYSIETNLQGVRVFQTIRNGGTVPDVWTLTDQDILGTYAFRIPFLGTIINFVKSPFGIAAVSVNVVVIISIIYIIKASKKEEIKKSSNEDQQP
ncbi:MAG: signal peptidase I [Acholeplasmataceae bacterium]|nr:signal peptidase I [Acholeplasmataceae bacterium]